MKVRLFSTFGLLLLCNFLQAQSLYKKIETKILVQDSLLLPSDLALVDDWLFVKAEMTTTKIVVVDAKTGDLIYQFGREGRGPAEYSNAFTIQKGISGSTLEVSDVINRKNDVYNVSCLKKKPKKSEVYKCILFSIKNTASRHSLILNERLVLNHGRDVNGNLYLSHDVQVTQYLNSIPPEISKKYAKPIHRILSMTGRLTANYNRDRFAYFADTFDWALFFSFDGTDAKLIKEKSFTYLPEFDTDDLGASSVMRASSKFRGGYYSPVSSEENYFVIYSGKTLDDISDDKDMNVADWRGHSNQILTYSFEGEKGRKYILDREVFIIEVSKDEDRLYGIHFDGRNYSIIKGEIPE